MQKDYNQWNQQKQDLNKRSDDLLPHFSEREIWICAFGKNIGNEQNGSSVKFERPVLIFRKYNQQNFFGFPLSSQAIPNRFSETVQCAKLTKTSRVIVTQGRTLSAKRLKRRLGKISHKNFLAVIKKSAGFLQPWAPSGEESAWSQNDEALIG